MIQEFTIMYYVTVIIIRKNLIETQNDWLHKLDFGIEKNSYTWSFIKKKNYRSSVCHSLQYLLDSQAISANCDRIRSSVRIKTISFISKAWNSNNITVFLEWKALLRLTSLDMNVKTLQVLFYQEFTLLLLEWSFFFLPQLIWDKGFNAKFFFFFFRKSRKVTQHYDVQVFVIAI